MRWCSPILAALLSSSASIFAQPVAPTPAQVDALRAASQLDSRRAAASTPLSVNVSSREEVRQFYRAVYSASNGVAMDWTGNYSNGTPGNTAPAFKDAVLLRINFFRALVGVPASVSLNSTFSAKAQEAALMMSANNALSHFPPTSWVFYTAVGADAAANSNLALGYAGADAITGYMHDNGSNNAAVGHRRWLIYPQTREIGTGDVPGNGTLLPANATWVFDGQFGTARPVTRTTAVPYPPSGFVPHELVWPRWSFSHPGADFSSASVSMMRNGQPISASLEPLSNNVGEPTVVWVYDGLDAVQPSTHPKPASDTVYTVNLTNVRISGAPQNFNYTVRVFDPDVAGSDHSPVAITGPANAVVGVASAYSVAKPAFASRFEWRMLQSLLTLPTYNAEGGLAGLVASVAPDYAPVQNGVVGSGAASFHLAHPVRADQTLTLPQTLVATGGASISFLSRLGFATATQVARVQVSTDDGVTWFDIYTQAGSGGAGESGFTNRTASLGALAGRTFRLRFNYTVALSGSSYPQTSAGVGWYLDNMTFAGVQAATPSMNTAVASGSSFSYTPTVAGTLLLQARGVLFDAFPLEWGPVATLNATASTGAPTFATHPISQSANPATTIVLNAAATGSPAFQWQRNGVDLAGATTGSLTLANFQPAATGVYTVIASNATGAATSQGAIVGLTSTTKLIGPGTEFPNILHAGTGFTYDQLLLESPAAAFTADFALNQITRLSYIDLSNDIVQVEFSGPGTVSLVLDNNSGPALPVNYNQAVSYMKGHAGIVVTGATENTHLSVFSVGRGNAVNQALFRDNVTYDGVADLAFIAIQSANGKFGGLRSANASYFATRGPTGIYAPGVAFTGPVFVSDINASDTATPVLLLGSASDVRVTGGDMQQANNRAIQVSGIAQLKFVDGSTSHFVNLATTPNQLLPAQTNQARFEQNGIDVTTQIVVNPGP